MEKTEMAVRCYTVPAKNKKTSYNSEYEENQIPDRILVFDTETTTDEYQNLLFGSFKIYDHGKLVYQGLFYGENVKKKELDILREYAKKHDIPLYPVGKFVDCVFLPEVYELKTLCIGFNLPFDLSRLAIHFSNSRKIKGGFSLQLSKNPKYPRLIIKHLDSKRAFFQFTNTISFKKGNNRKRKGKSNKFRGNFLDLRTLAFALTNEKHSLESACELFNAEKKKVHAEEHGKITPEYIKYNINDVEATYGLYLKLMEEYKKYGLDIPPTKIYSPASIGKAYLNMMGIKSFSEKNPDFPNEILGYVMTTYYGGRSEVRIRKQPVKIALIDFLSMYPTMCILQNLWKFVIAEKIEWYDDTENIKDFVDNATIETFSNPENWRKLTAIVLVLPDNDIFPVRSKYGEKNTYNIGLNYVTSEKPVWYTLADVIASKLLTGKTPNILKAIRFKPVGIQTGLKAIELVGKKLDPTKQDFFKELMEYRNKLKKQNDNREKIIKIITNATSYGIFVEINPMEKKNVEINVYGLEQFTNTKNIVENFGKAFNPLMATFITSASRLVLAISEAILNKHNGAYAFCDTDSLAIPPEYVKEIQDYFQKLSPYSFDDPLFKLEEENFNEETKELEPLWFYGLSAKRYALYNMRDGKPVIRKYSLHGLGHILNPFDSNRKDWHKQIWQDILNEHYGLVDSEELQEKYRGLYAIGQLTVSSPHIMQRFEKINRGKPIEKQIKPFNFILVGVSNQTDENTLKPIVPVSPYRENHQRIVYKEFIDYNTGKTLNGVEYWKTLDTVFWEYKNHPESKFDGNIGKLERKYLGIDSIIHIGKETNNLEESEVIGVQRDNYQIYQDKETQDKKLKEMIMNLKPKTAKRYGISKRQLYRWKKKIREGKELRLYKKTRERIEIIG